MCELFALSASARVDIKVSLAELARHGGETGIHADGWGAAFMDGRDARLFREPAAAATSPWVRCLQANPVQSDTVIAHIRHATQGARTLSNTQPFVREFNGRAWVFAHNGHLDLGRSTHIEFPRFRPMGETDSEAAFCILMDELARADGDEVAAFSAFARHMRQQGPANIILASQGRLLVHADRRTQRPGVIEPPGLWMLHRTCGPTEFSRAGVTVKGAALSVVLFASVPLSAEPWQPLARGMVLAVEQGRVLSTQQL